MKERKEIERLLGEHLIAWFIQDNGAMKAHYAVTPTNLADFIDRWFIKRKTPKHFSQVLEDSHQTLTT